MEVINNFFNKIEEKIKNKQKSACLKLKQFDEYFEIWVYIPCGEKTWWAMYTVGDLLVKNLYDEPSHEFFTSKVADKFIFSFDKAKSEKAKQARKVKHGKKQN